MTVIVDSVEEAEYRVWFEKLKDSGADMEVLSFDST